MSYYVADANGYVGDLASGGGMHELLAWLREQADPMLIELATQGYTAMPKGMAVALRTAMAGTRGTLRETITNLADLLDICQEAGIMTDGVTKE